MKKEESIREIAFNKLLPLLAYPADKDSFHFNPIDNTLENELGNKYFVKNFLPVFINKTETEDTNSEFDYTTHYSLDSDMFDYFEERKGGTAHDEQRLREYILSLVNYKPKNILDVGCGRAWVAEHFTADSHVCSMDIGIINPEKAISKYSNSNHSAIVADCNDMPFRTGSFDLIIASEIIEHLVAPAKLIENCFRVLAPGCSLLISTPYKETLKYELCIHCHQRTPVNGHLHSFDENILKNLFNHEDIDTKECFAFGNKALLHLRTHVALKYLEFGGWKFVDKLANLFINSRAHIILKITKKA